MSGHLFRKHAAVLVLLGGLLPAGLQAAAPPRAISWIPPSAFASLEIVKPAALLDLVLSPEVVSAVTVSPAWKRFEATPKSAELKKVVAFFTSQLGTDWQTGLRKLFGGGVTLAVGGQGAVVAVVDAEDEGLLQRAHRLLVGISQAEAVKSGQPTRTVPSEYEGVTLWTFREGQAYVILGKRLVWSNKQEVLKAILDQRGRGQSLTQSPSYRAATAAMGDKSAVRLYLSLDVARKIPKLQPLFAANTQPLAALVLGGLADSLQQSTWLAMGLETLPTGLRLTATLPINDREDKAAFARPSKEQPGAAANFQVPGQIAAISLLRDLHGFYAAKEKLFPERTSGLIFFENMMGIFFSGRDLTEEVLAQAKPDIRFVVARQKYASPQETPQIQIPGFAAVMRVREPAQFGPVMEEAWQKAVGLVNVTRGQKAEPGLIFDRETHAGVRYSFAYFSPAPGEDKQALPIRFNFRPSLVRAGEYLILSSCESLARDLIDAVQREKSPAAVAGSTAIVELSAVELATILEADRVPLARQNMLKEGTTLEEASGKLDIVSALLRRFDGARFELGRQAAGMRAVLELKLKVAGGS